MPNSQLRQSIPDSDRNQIGATTSVNAKLSVRQAAVHLGVSKSWLDKKRLDGNGPNFLKFGRRVLYDLQDLEAYSARMRRQHTSEPA
jgi:hypothetical protein